MPLFLGENEISQVIVSVQSADGGVNTSDATLTSGAEMLAGVTAYSKGTKYTGTIPIVEGPVPDVSVSDNGVITASVSNPKGYQSSATTKTSTQQLTTQGIKVITPNDSVQTAVNAGVYTIGPITVSAVPAETKTITANGTYSPSAGKYFSSVEVAITGDTPTYQSKTVSPSTSIQTVTADAGYDALSDVIVNAIQTETKSVTPTTSTQTVIPTSGKYLTKVSVGAIQTETKSVTSNGTYNPTSGKYFSSITVNVPEETFNTQTKTVTPTESTQTISPDNGYDGLSTVTVNPISSTYVGSAVPTKGATTITPSSNSQTAISSGTYATGNITVSAVPSETKEITSNGTYAPTDGKWFSSVTVDVPSSGIDTSDATATADDIAKNKTAYVGGEKITGNVHVYESGTINTMNIDSNLYDDRSISESDGKIYFTDGFFMPGLYRNGVTVKMYTSLDNFGDATAADVAVGKTFTSSDGFKVTGTAIIGESTPKLHNKSATPTESEQVIAPDSGYDGLSSVTISAIPSTYVGSGVTRKGTTTITPSTSSRVAVPSGTYTTGDITVSAMPTGALSTPSINTSTGVVTAGVVTSGYLSTSDTKTLQLTTKSAATITPNTTDQTIAAGQYLTGTQTIKGDANLVPENIISGKSIFGVSGSVVIQKYYTGTTEPSSSLGNDGDIYMKV